MQGPLVPSADRGLLDAPWLEHAPGHGHASTHTYAYILRARGQRRIEMNGPVCQAR